MILRTRPLPVTTPVAALLVGVVALIMMAGCAESVPPAQGDPARFSQPASAIQSQTEPAPTPRTLLALADILAAQGKEKDCEFVLSTCIRQHPDFVPAYNSLAELQIRQGRIAEAAEGLAEALQIWPNDAVLLNNMGMCCLIRRDYETALAFFTRAAVCAPDRPRYQANRATSLGMLGRDAEALAVWRRILPEEMAAYNLDVLQRARQKASDTSEKGLSEPTCIRSVDDPSGARLE